MFSIVSGGQTGVDRGALDAALQAGISCGGWCPADFLAEDGVIDARYGLVPLPQGGYAERTRRNVMDSDATLILYFGGLEGGTALTAACCEDLGKPLLQIDALEIKPGLAARQAHDFIALHCVVRLNVAGPRASENPAAYGYALDTVSRLLERPGTGGNPG
ncbi:MAG TPA: putative molybdenum carrier protein [Gammaproteobacteria bacterium]|nr:putative molybdenum carrier protein [Gammaproteobacteria bacterium]